MILEIILLSKNNEKISRDTIVDDFRSKLEFKNDQILCDELIFKYTFQESKNNNIRLKINTLNDKSPSTKAKELDYLKNIIRNGKHRENYRIIIVYDESSAYFCSKLTNFISKFERKLRKVIYILILAAYGNNWIEETFSDEIMKVVSEVENNKNRHIEMALECFTFQDFIDYLFNRRYEIELEEVISSAINVARDPENNNEDIIKILNKAKKVSLWDKLFDGYGMEFLQGDIDKIRKIRNDVMHNKEISTEEFDSYKKLLRDCNKKLDKAILKVEDEKYPDTINIADIFYSLSETMQSMMNLGKSVIESIAPAIKDLIKIADKITKTINIEKISELYNLSLKSNLVNKSQLINQSYINSISSLQKSLVSNNIFENASFNSNIIKGAVPNFNYISKDYKELYNPMLKIRTSSIDYKSLRLDNGWIKNITHDYNADIFNFKISNITKSAFKQNEHYNNTPLKLSETIKSLKDKNNPEDDGADKDDSEY